MPVIANEAVERSTFVITASFTDRNGTAVTPTGITWALTDGEGNVINSRSGVSVSAVAGVATITLSGADLAVDGQKRVRRVLSISGTYGGYPVREDVVFFIRPMLDFDTSLSISGMRLALSVDNANVTEDA